MLHQFGSDKRPRRLISVLYPVLLSLILLMASVSGVLATDLDGYELVAENSQFQMYLDPRMPDVAVLCRETGHLWTTIPQDWNRAAGLGRFIMSSQIILELQPMRFVWSSRDSVQRNAYRIERMGFAGSGLQMEEGVRIIYEFPLYGITVPVEFRLVDDGMSVRIPFDQVVETSDSHTLVRIEVLPSMMGSQPMRDGYLFLPDGSGTLVEFARPMPTGSPAIRQRVYGRDLGIEVFQRPIKAETARMPVFGVYDGEKGFVGIVESCDFSATIGSDYRFNFIRGYTTFNFRETYRILFRRWGRGEAVGDAASVSYLDYTTRTTVEEDMVIRYVFLTGDDAEYSGMAAAYREHLVSKGVLRPLDPEADIPLYVSLFGAYRMQRTVLGLPMSVVVPLTRFDRAIEILDSLAVAGLDTVSLRYVGAHSGGYESTVTRTVSPDWKIGGGSGLRRLVEYSEENGVRLSMNAEILKFYDRGNGVSARGDSVRYSSGALAMQWRESPVFQVTRPEGDPGFLLTPKRIPGMAQSYISDLVRYGISGISFEYLGNIFYSEYRRGREVFKDRSGALFTEALELAASGMESVMVVGGSAYSFPYITDVIGAPMSHSHYDSATRQVPFYQMVLHGYIPYTGTPANLWGDARKGFLRSIEYGALLHYIWIAEDSSVLRDSWLSGLYSGYYGDWVETAAELYSEMTGILEQTYGVSMTRHMRIESGLYSMEYANGARIFVNYNDATMIYGDIEIKPLSYHLEPGGGSE